MSITSTEFMAMSLSDRANFMNLMQKNLQKNLQKEFDMIKNTPNTDISSIPHCKECSTLTPVGIFTSHCCDCKKYFSIFDKTCDHSSLKTI
jgi:hypothetical protein